MLRSLTKLWSIPGIRAGYLLAEPQIVDELRQGQTPWSVSAPAIAALIATSTETAREEAGRGPRSSPAGASTSPTGLAELGIETVPRTAPFVLARTGPGSREACAAPVSRSGGPTPSPAWTTLGPHRGPPGVRR